jgi:RNA polymerase sigma factor (sigma-70 family)
MAAPKLTIQDVVALHEAPTEADRLLRWVMQMETNQEIHLALRCLSSRERNIIVFKYFFGLSTTEVSWAIGMTPHSVDDKTTNAYHHLRDLLLEIWSGQ